MTTVDTKVDLVINKLTKTQFDNASGLNNEELWLCDPEFTGGKLLQSNSNGDIVESNETPLTIQVLSATDSITLADNYCYQGGEQTSLTIALPSSATVSFIAQITFKSGTTPTAITVPQTGFVWDKRGEDVSGGVFTAVANKVYTMLFVYDGYQFIAFVEGTNYAG